ncbi:hypothetical protein [Halopseudomonas pelagia]|uniref:Uncharacterized protein n=1 Tax=Halopseudomonas pelagia TaxID=553151 RepID=A0AA91TYV1_9GAMM|nr:hypothetical protein [Halopseudomonas pelagia]PCC97327.1 hypothetical protein CO192_21390 [Halopseudomonas pelagia]QFY58515.1 hypothetical protein EAO82_20450 [Halopseudomonas pelagia]
MQKGNEVALDELVGQYPSYQWRIWTRRYCEELGNEVLSASSFFLDVPQEILFFAPAIGDGKLDALLEELNARAGWDGAIQNWQSRRLRALIAELPLPTPGVVGHG